LLSLFLGAWLLLSGLTYLSARQEAVKLFDAQLAQSARVLLSLTLHELEEDEHSPITAPDISKKMVGHHDEERLAFQIWKQDVLLLYSPNSPRSTMAQSAGYSDRNLSGRPWRVFALFDQEGQVRIEVAEDYKIRNELIYRILRQTLLPLLLSLPLLAIALWIAVGRGLAPLKKVAREISARTPNQLEPLDVANVPEETKPLAVSLNQLLEELRTALESERRFTANAAHELRTPLAALKAQADVALRTTNQAEQSEGLRQVIRGVDRATRLVGQMLTLARLDPDAATAIHRRVDLRSVTARVLGELAPAALDKNIELSFFEGEAVEILSHDSNLEILVRNLIDNAIRYTPEDGKVQIDVRLDSDRARLTVADTGPGIPEGERDRVLDRFYRISGNRAPGCGLGLSIVKRIAVLHGASVELDCPPWGNGLQICIDFPAA
jgi:two-component system sensor histidine kinase QseC